MTLPVDNPAPESPDVGENQVVETHNTPDTGELNTTVEHPIPVTIEQDGLGFSDFLNIGMFIVTLVSLVVAVCSFRSSAKTAKQASDNAEIVMLQMDDIVSANEQSAQVSRRQLEQLESMMATGSMILYGLQEVENELSRPRMNAYLEAPSHPAGYLRLIVENVGMSPACDVQVSFDPELPEPDLDRLNANTSEIITFQKSTVEMIHQKYAGKTFKTWSPNQSTGVIFWATKFKKYPLREIGESKMFKNEDGSPAQALIVRNGTDGPMILDESAEGIRADTEVVISYSDGKGNKWRDTFSLNPEIWVSTTFSETDRKGIEHVYGSEN